MGKRRTTTNKTAILDPERRRGTTLEHDDYALKNLNQHFINARKQTVDHSNGFSSVNGGVHGNRGYLNIMEAAKSPVKNP